ncbi:hypothetical protein B0H11DRAFT_2423743 [Mycena galericulata]|nr:hypothetical protein B0H11DRAFT_2423743 [Mycena galericulata]
MDGLRIPPETQCQLQVLNAVVKSTYVPPTSWTNSGGQGTEIQATVIRRVPASSVPCWSRILRSDDDERLELGSLVKHVENLAELMIPLWAPLHVTRIAVVPPRPHGVLECTHSFALSTANLPRATQEPYSAFPFTLTLTACSSMFHILRLHPPAPVPTPTSAGNPAAAAATAGRSSPSPSSARTAATSPRPTFHVGPSPPCATSPCSPNASSAAPHRLHAAEIHLSGHHRACPGRERRVGARGKRGRVGGARGRNYRRGQREAFLVAHLQVREGEVMCERWMRVVEATRAGIAVRHELYENAVHVF